MPRSATAPFSLGALVPGLLLVGTLAACSKAAEVPTAVDGNLSTTVAELERQVAELKAERNATLKAAGVTGTEYRTLVQAVADLRDEVTRLKDRPVPAIAATPSPSADDPAAPSPPRLPTTFFPESDGRFNEEQIVAFKALEDAVRKRREEEQQRDRLQKVLEEASVRLTDAQHDALLRLQREFGEKRQALAQSQRTLGRTANESDADALRAQFNVLREEHEAAVRAAVPDQDDKVVEVLRRAYQGFFPRTENGPGPARRGGRAGN